MAVSLSPSCLPSLPLFLPCLLVLAPSFLAPDLSKPHSWGNTLSDFEVFPAELLITDQAAGGGGRGWGQEAALYAIPTLISFLCYRTHTYTHRRKENHKNKKPLGTAAGRHSLPPSIISHGRGKAGLPCDIVNLSGSLPTEIKQGDCRC